MDIVKIQTSAVTIVLESEECGLLAHAIDESLASYHFSHRDNADKIRQLEASMTTLRACGVAAGSRPTTSRAYWSEGNTHMKEKYGEEA